MNPTHLSGRACKEWGRYYKLVAGAKYERRTTLEPVEAQEEESAPTIVLETSDIVGAQRRAQHVYAILPMSTEVGAEARPSVDSTPGENGLEAWSRLVRRFDPAHRRRPILTS